MGKYALDMVHTQFPDAKLGIVVASRGEMIRDLFAHVPYIEVIEANRRDPRGLYRLWQRFRNSDLVVTQYAGKRGGVFSFSSKLFARLLCKKGGLVGFADASKLNHYLYDRLVPEVFGVAPAELERRALRAVGVPTSGRPTLECTVPTQVLEKFDVQKGRYIVVHLFAGNRGRGLDPQKKRELLQALVRTLPDTTVVVTGTTSEKAEATEAARDLPVTVVAGETSVQEMLQLIAGSAGVVSVDTGAAHMAAQLSVPLVVLATCLGLHWWKPEQYGTDAPITLYTHPESEGHVFKDYPECINAIDMNVVATQLATWSIIKTAR